MAAPGVAVTGTSRLRWFCRRGMKELDVLLSRYLDAVYPDATAAEQRGFERLLAYQDPELYALLTGRDRVDDEEIDGVVQRIRRDAGL